MFTGMEENSHQVTIFKAASTSVQRQIELKTFYMANGWRRNGKCNFLHLNGSSDLYKLMEKK